MDLIKKIGEGKKFLPFTNFISAFDFIANLKNFPENLKYF